MKQFLIILTIISSFTSYSQKLARGPEIGEIYFLGPTNTGTGLYYSIDFGATAVCVDSIKNLHSITADKMQGCLYGMEITPNLYFSNNFGYTGSWVYKTSGMYPELRSGVTEGYIFNNIESHSEDYGSSFINHTINGFFGSLKASEIDIQIGTGYAVTKSSWIPDSVFFLITYDNFENLTIKYAYHKHEYLQNYIRRGNNIGEIFTIRNRPFSFDPFEIYYSENFGDSFILKNKINFSNFYSFDVEGGRENGELYLLYNFVNLMWQNAHTYIFHSIDYGNTFEVYHPFSKGNEPVLANFSTIEKEVPLTTPVELSNFSIGEITEYQWDFENDGIIDSYDEFPTHIYQDTGYFSVRLSVVGQDSTNTFIKENYIHVIDTITCSPDLNYQEINIFPNPLRDKISIELRPDFQIIGIYDLNGKCHFTKTIDQGNKTEIIDLRSLKKGIYILKIKTEGQNITKKIIKI